MSTEFRRYGIGTRLLKWVFHEAELHNGYFQDIYLHTPACYTPAHGFYLRNGFKQTAALKNFYDKEDGDHSTTAFVFTYRLPEAVIEAPRPDTKPKVQAAQLEMERLEAERLAAEEAVLREAERLAAEARLADGPARAQNFKVVEVEAPPQDPDAPISPRTHGVPTWAHHEAGEIVESLLENLSLQD